MNIVCLTGRLGADPDVKTFADGGRIANLRLAVSEKWTDRATGEKKERTDWIGVVVRGEGLVNFATAKARKGARLTVSGKLRVRDWIDQSGAKKWATEVHVVAGSGVFELVDWPEDGGSGGGYGGSAGASPPPPTADDLDDEIPF